MWRFWRIIFVFCFDYSTSSYSVYVSCISISIRKMGIRKSNDGFLTSFMLCLTLSCLIFFSEINVRSVVRQCFNGFHLVNTFFVHVVLLEKAFHTPGNVCEKTSEWIVAELKITDARVKC